MLYTITLFLLYGIFFFSSTKLTAEEIVQRTVEYPLNTAQKEEYVVHWARAHLPQIGVLIEEQRGFVYLKVDDNYINQLFSILNPPEYTKPQYFRRFDSPGAHISVFYVDERNRTGEIKEKGQKYSFKIKGLSFVPPKTQEYLVLEVESPDLEQLRKNYGLSPLLQGHPFHITIAKKKRRYH